MQSCLVSPAIHHTHQVYSRRAGYLLTWTTSACSLWAHVMYVSECVRERERERERFIAYRQISGWIKHYTLSFVSSLLIHHTLSVGDEWTRPVSKLFLVESHLLKDEPCGPKRVPRCQCCSQQMQISCVVWHHQLMTNARTGISPHS